ncbi:hypothetical protein HK096_005310 [Nowakowskiella sp. JEL0078]|nr:hypothetical protein HK096_005310 [Nowakowskiella sp. JEL0078]
MQIIGTAGLIVLLYGVNLKLEGGIGMLVPTPIGILYWGATGWFAYRSAIMGDIPSHQRWIIRNWSISFSIIIIRPVVVVLVSLHDVNPENIEYISRESLSTASSLCLISFGFLSEIFIYANFKEGIFTTIENDFPHILPQENVTALPTATGFDVTQQKTLRKVIQSKFTRMALIARHEYPKTGTVLYRFQIEALENTVSYMTILPTQHIIVSDILRSIHGEEELWRSYTPISTDVDHRNGFIDLLVSRSGRFSNHLAELEIGQSLSLLGHPVGRLVYQSNAQPAITFIAVGSGITPVFALLRSMVQDRTSVAQIKLIYYGKKVEESDDGVPLSLEIMDLVNYSRKEKGATIELVEIRLPNEKKITKDNIIKSLPDIAVARSHFNKFRNSWDVEIGVKACVFICGPAKMEHNTLDILRNIGFDRELVWAFGVDGH